MPLPSSINDLSTTAGSNSPAGSESPSTIDDYLRVHASYIAMLRDAAQNNSFSMATAGGSANAITATYSPAVVTVSDSTVLMFKAAVANTGATTFSPNGLTAAPIIGGNHTALQGGEIVPGGDVWVQWNSAFGGGSWVLLESSGGDLQVASASQSLHAPNAGQIQAQSLTAFATGGVSATLTLTPAPAITAYAANQRFRVKFGFASTGTDTLNISGMGAKSIKQYSASGAKVAAVFAANQLADVEYDGTDIVLLDQLSPSLANIGSVQGTAKNLILTASGTAATVSITADELALEHLSDGTYVTVKNVSLTATTAAGGLDTGTSAINTWYAVWLIYNPTTSASAGQLSLSSTNPAVVTGYTYRVRVGWVRTDGNASNKYPLSFIQYGRRASYKVATGSNVAAMPIMVSGAQGSLVTPTWIAASVSGFVPPTASVIYTVLNTTGGFQQMAAPNNSYGSASSTTNPPPLLGNPGGSAAYMSSAYGMQLESTNIYVASSGGNIFCAGWEDNL